MGDVLLFALLVYCLACVSHLFETERYRWWCMFCRAIMPSDDDGDANEQDEG